MFVVVRRLFPVAFSFYARRSGGDYFPVMPTIAPSTLTIRVLLFASYAETLGCDALELVLENPATVGDAVERLRALPRGERLPPRPLCALNLAQTSLHALLSAGDELAILPPLAGG